jgi:diguanylate cyclase (GGDEF)-like protein
MQKPHNSDRSPPTKKDWLPGGLKRYAWEISAIFGLLCYFSDWRFQAAPTILRYLWVPALLWPMAPNILRSLLGLVLVGSTMYFFQTTREWDRIVDTLFVLVNFAAGMLLAKRIKTGSSAERKLASLLNETPQWTQEFGNDQALAKASIDEIIRRQKQQNDQLHETLFSLLQSCASLNSALTTALLWREEHGFAVREVYTGSDHFKYEYRQVAPDGVLGWVVANKRSWISSELSSTIQSPLYHRDEGVHSLLVAPILDGETLKGLLYIDSRFVQSFDASNQSLVEVFSRLILDHIRFNEEMLQYDVEKARVEAFFAAANRLFEPTDLQKLAGTLFETIQAISPVDGILMALKDQDELKITAYRGAFLSRFLGVSVEHDSLLDWTAHSLQGIYIANTDATVRPILGKNRKIDQIQSTLIIPLQRGEETIGALALLSRERDRFSPHETLLYENLKQIFAVAVFQRRSYSNVKSLASTDPLTKLFNRRFFFEKFEKEIRRHKRSGAAAACVMVDVDHFKSVNDTHGHQVGDDVLAAVASVLRSGTREHDITGRFGGEEFAILCPEVDQKSVQRMCERLRKKISTLKFEGADGAMFSVTASFGVAMFPAHANTSQAMVQVADNCLYEAKRSGRNRVIVASEPFSSSSTLTDGLGS